MNLSDIGKPEYVTQERAIQLFVDELGYRYLGDSSDRDSNGNVEEEVLSSWLAKREYAPAQINAASNLDEQIAIAAVLPDMDPEIATQETKLTKARQLKTGMMQELLTGRIRLL